MCPRDFNENDMELLRQIYLPMSSKSPQNRRFNRDMLARLIVRLYRDIIANLAIFYNKLQIHQKPSNFDQAAT